MPSPSVRTRSIIPRACGDHWHIEAVGVGDLIYGPYKTLSEAQAVADVLETMTDALAAERVAESASRFLALEDNLYIGAESAKELAVLAREVKAWKEAKERR